MTRRSAIPAAPVGQQRPPARAAASAVGALRSARGSSAASTRTIEGSETLRSAAAAVRLPLSTMRTKLLIARSLSNPITSFYGVVLSILGASLDFRRRQPKLVQSSRRRTGPGKP